MATKKKLSDFDIRIANLNEQINKERAEKKRAEDAIKSSIGNEYVNLLKLENSNIELEEVLLNIKNLVKEKRQEKKNKANNNI